MSWRIEQTHPLDLLGELPDQWAQACVTTPPANMQARDVLEVLAEMHRVLRDDGTVWLALHGYPDAHELAWQLRQTAWLRPLRASVTPGQTLLLAKSTGFLFKPPHTTPTGRLPRRPCTPHALQAGRGRRCDCGRGRVERRRACAHPTMSGFSAIAWCVLASSTRRACHVCGTPTSRGRRSRRPVCVHAGQRRGRCLILDPFCRTGSTGLAAIRHSRHYLGIEADWLHAQIARRRLARLERQR